MFELMNCYAIREPLKREWCNNGKPFTVVVVGYNAHTKRDDAVVVDHGAMYTMPAVDMFNASTGVILEDA